MYAITSIQKKKKKEYSREERETMWWCDFLCGVFVPFDWFLGFLPPSSPSGGMEVSPLPLFPPLSSISQG